MKRVTFQVDSELLRAGLRLSGEKTAADLIRRALAEYVRRLKAAQIFEYLGSGIWEGDLSQMRGDRPRRRRPSQSPRHSRPAKTDE